MWSLCVMSWCLSAPASKRHRPLVERAITPAPLHTNGAATAPTASPSPFALPTTAVQTTQDIQQQRSSPV